VANIISTFIILTTDCHQRKEKNDTEIVELNKSTTLPEQTQHNNLNCKKVGSKKKLTTNYFHHHQYLAVHKKQSVGKKEIKDNILTILRFYADKLNGQNGNVSVKKS
jgi:hypothetical protein